ncbi:MAG TPA: farnesyl diphosphate synthase [Candidatus Bathyarchaeia archaeon]|nr:farnesyl diphosphate synthase [Candidatus Bathyarchaeia archaeon]
MSAVEDFLKDKSAKMDQALSAYVDSWSGAPGTLVDAIRYSLFAGGKRVRPALALGAAELICGDDAVALPAACALEMIHTYSLIHDDLPAMDDDDLRRGKPTLHKVYGEALAILAGDALSTMAFDVLTESGNVRVIRELAVAAGVSGMAGGQVLDLESEGKRVSLEELRVLHAKKTGALIRVAVRCGGILAGADEAQLADLTWYGEHVGLAFQIADDVLDVIGAEDVMGKRAGSDAAKDKSTYPALLGVEESQRLANKAAERAVAALAKFGSEADIFRALARYIVERTK